MKGDDWQPMETAPLNPYGKPWGPSVLIWDRATRTAITAYFEPWHGYKDRDCGPAWIVDDGSGDTAIAPEDAGGWMPVEPPDGERGSNAMLRCEAPIKDFLTTGLYDWRELHQEAQPLLADGYTAVMASHPGVWLVKGPGPDRDENGRFSGGSEKPKEITR